MKKILFSIPILIILVVINACNQGKKEGGGGGHSNLTNAKDTLSYILGSINAKTIVGSGAEAFDNLDKKEIISGFNANLSNYSADDCLITLKN